MIRKNTEQTSYDSDDHSRYAGPEYLDRVSLSKSYGHYSPVGMGKGPKDYKRSDARIYEDVCESLLNDRHVDASNIEVEVSSGLVTLRGTVENREMKKEAERCIEDVSGVEDIFNLLKIQQFVDSGAEGLIKTQSRLEP